MKNFVTKLAATITTLGFCHLTLAQDLVSVALTDVIKSQGTGNIDLFKDVTASALEQFRLDNDGFLVIAVDINEAASGTEKASSQGIAVKLLRLTIGFDDGSELVLDSAASSCCFSETQALLAEAPDVSRQLYYTLLGESGSSRITSNNTVQDVFDSTLKFEIPETLHSDNGPLAVSAQLQVVLLQTNDALGDPEAFYDFSAGFEDLALLNAADVEFIDTLAAGREEAPTVILTNPPVVIDPMAITNWNYFPSSTSFYVVGYEDLYPNKGDYDFNDLTVAYRLQHGLNGDGDVVAIQGLAYLITRGSAYSHDWRLGVAIQGNTSGTLSCTTYPDYRNPTISQPCSQTGSTSVSGNLDLTVFEDTRNLFPDPAGSVFVNSQRLYSSPWNLKFFPGPRSEFRVDLSAPVSPLSVAAAPFDPYLYVRDTQRIVKLLEVDASYQDSTGFPFGMLLTAAWKPPLEFTDTSVAYPNFNDFVSSEGSTSATWYETYLTDFIVDIPTSDQWAW